LFKSFFVFSILRGVRSTHAHGSLSLSSLSLSPRFHPQVKPELANVTKLAASADFSLARAGFTSDCEAALNEQIK
jgi:hypothetical protein